jgi:fatty-acyl-CoA synthase
MIRVFSDKYGVEILHAWGMTETSPLCTVARPPAGATGEDAWRYRYTQGRFPASVRARLVADDGSELPWDDKSVGGLEVGGPWVTATYYAPEDSPISDADKFHDGWLRTGDVGHISPDGFLSLTDRTKDVIKSGGEWISSVELENIVMGHPAIAEAAVVGIPDSKWGERPLVAVVLRAGHDADAEQLRDYIAASIPRWQVPENWSFISQIPKTSTGKFDKKRLRADHSVGALQVLRVDQSDHRT